MLQISSPYISSLTSLHNPQIVKGRNSRSAKNSERHLNFQPMCWEREFSYLHIICAHIMYLFIYTMSTCARSWTFLRLIWYSVALIDDFQSRWSLHFVQSVSPCRVQSHSKHTTFMSQDRVYACCAGRTRGRSWLSWKSMILTWMLQHTLYLYPLRYICTFEPNLLDVLKFSTVLYGTGRWTTRRWTICATLKWKFSALNFRGFFWKVGVERTRGWFAGNANSSTNDEP